MHKSLKKNLGWIIFWAITSNYTINSWIMLGQSFKINYIDKKIEVLQKRADPEILEEYGFNFPNSVEELNKLKEKYERGFYRSVARSFIYGYFI